MIIGIDAGHGGHDPGAIGARGTREKDIVLDIQYKLLAILEKQGHKVILSRKKDEFVSLEERVKIFNKAHCDRIISLHINAFTSPAPNYLSAWIVASGGNAEQMSKAILPCLEKTSGWTNGGIRKSNFYIVRKTIAPAVLLELGFISNPQQEEELKQEDFRLKLAHAINCGLYLHLKEVNLH